jgi:hypothetical protein
MRQSYLSWITLTWTPLGMAHTGSVYRNVSWCHGPESWLHPGHQTVADLPYPSSGEHLPHTMKAQVKSLQPLLSISHQITTEKLLLTGPSENQPSLNIGRFFLSPCWTILCKGSLTKPATPLNRLYIFLVPVLAGFEKFHWIFF